ncbi:hypothetical protein AGLY_010974 [Aphis glycines]|uniref:Uncharacterized protein n=1 Tax=Aphis glycines TaxID=307491 RepID=A0A6G0TCI9_APHGL|nr:hypothetical protein AGLY_010974 [Aphis glycines]
MNSHILLSLGSAFDRFAFVPRGRPARFFSIDELLAFIYLIWRVKDNSHVTDGRNRCPASRTQARAVVVRRVEIATVAPDDNAVDQHQSSLDHNMLVLDGHCNFRLGRGSLLSDYIFNPKGAIASSCISLVAPINIYILPKKLSCPFVFVLLKDFLHRYLNFTKALVSYNHTPVITMVFNQFSNLMCMFSAGEEVVARSFRLIAVFEIKLFEEN